MGVVKAIVAGFVTLGALGAGLDVSPLFLLAVPVGARVTWSNLRSGLVGRAHMVVTADRLTIVHKGLFRKPETISRDTIAVAAFDTRPTPLKRFRDHPRFHLASLSDNAGQPEWLYSRVTGSPFPLASQVPDMPNLVLVFRDPLVFAKPRRFVKAFPSKQLTPPPLHRRAARGLLLRVTDPDRARAALESWGVVRPLLTDDLEACAPKEVTVRRSKRLALRDNVVLGAIIVVQSVLPFFVAEEAEGASPGRLEARLQLGVGLGEHLR